MWLDPTQASVPLNVAQARRIKTDMVEAIYQEQRTRSRLYPISGYGNLQFDGADEAIKYMSAVATAAAVGGQEVSDLLSSVINGLNYNALTIENDNNLAGPFQTMTTNWNQVHSSETALQVGWMVAPVNTPAPGGFHLHNFADYRDTSTLAGHSGVGGFYNQNQILGGVTPTPPQITWQPLNTANQVNVPFSEFLAALRMFVNNRTDLATRRLVMRSQIAALPDIDAIVAYDVTLGWPS